MKNFCLIFLLIFGNLHAQNIQSDFLVSGSEVPMLSFDKPSDIDELINAEAVKGQIYNFGKFVVCDITSQSDGKWTDVDGGRVWSLAIHAEDAKGLSLYYDDFWIPSGGELYIYNPSQSQKIGPFTTKNNHSSGVFATELIYGDMLILEYFQPYFQTEDLKLSINRFAYAYRDISGGELSGYNSSDDCQVNANCSEGDAWENQKKSVCRIQIGSGWNVGLCSGALVNNTLNNCTPYVLSADHCFSGGDISDNGLNQSIFYFNYRSSNCSNSVPNNTYSITGCSKVANSGGEGNVGDPDFFLVELNSDPDFDPYFSGWNRSNTAATSGVSIHHPSGDIMKISTFTNNLTSSSGLGFGFDNTTHWQVQWSGTNNGYGVTEGGSSGSPIYNQNALLVGVLTGGSSFCDATNQTDIYGKLWHGWDQFSNSTSEQLKPWLDPANTNVISLNGLYCNQSAVVTAAFNSSETNVCLNSSVTFSSLSSGEISSYQWQFNGGTPSSANGPGPHTINYSSPGNYDVSLSVTGTENTDEYAMNNYISVSPNLVELEFLPDCYGEETSWELQNANGQTLYSVSSGYYPGGNNAQDMQENPQSVTEDWCLFDGCYKFIVEDEYGDGLYGSQHTCEFDGDFTIYDDNSNVLADLNVLNSDFGEEITLEFCVESGLSISSNISNELLFALFPNPTSGRFVLESRVSGLVKVYNTLSQEVYSSFKNNIKHPIELRDLESGVYFVHFNNSIQKLIIQ
ncbi:T9SS type A sorting domain-containing protein [Flavobacteriales bacterium]|nr:T9SS type A sorting domain-containing protein [Flavobacteriales bacterium]